MPFERKFNLNQLVPDEHFDHESDIVRVKLEQGQTFYVSILNRRLLVGRVATDSTSITTWGVRTEDPTMPDAMRQSLKRQFPDRHPGIQVDKIEIGSHALLSAFTFDWRGIWRSKELVTDIQGVRRTDTMESTIVIEENR